MSYNKNSFRPRPRPKFCASFRGLKVRSFGIERILKADAAIELRPLSTRSALYGVYHSDTNGRLVPRGYCLRDAKAAAEAMFQEQLTPWEEVKPCSSR
jgi:hypothetical protein